MGLHFAAGLAADAVTSATMGEKALSDRLTRGAAVMRASRLLTCWHGQKATCGVALRSNWAGWVDERRQGEQQSAIALMQQSSGRL
jgi:hypothetical protein